MARVNVAILGNRESQFHAHVIPRRETDGNAGLAPWDRAPAYVPLTKAGREDLMVALAESFRRVPDVDS